MKKVLLFIVFIVTSKALIGQKLYERSNLVYPNRGHPNIFWSNDYIKSKKNESIEEYTLCRDSIYVIRSIDYFDEITGNILKTIDNDSKDSTLYFWSGNLFLAYKKYSRGQVVSSYTVSYEFPKIVFIHDNSRRHVCIFNSDSTLSMEERYDNTGELISKTEHFQRQNLKEQIYTSSNNKSVKKIYDVNCRNQLTIVGFGDMNEIELVESASLSNDGFLTNFTRYYNNEFSSRTYKYDDNGILYQINYENDMVSVCYVSRYR